MMILLHGVAGSSRSDYMEELSGACADAGINVVVFHHHGPPNESNCRLMNMCYNDYMDEVIAYAQKKFNNNDIPCEIYLAGFSLGGNHILRYTGQATKEKEQGK